MSRLTAKDPSQFNESQSELYDALTRDRAPRQPGEIGGPFDGWLLNAEMGRRIVGLGNFFRFRTSVDRRQVELVILVTGAFWRAQFEWYAHEPMAREAGLPDDIISAIKAGTSPNFNDEKDAAAYHLAAELHANHKVSDATYTEAVKQFGEQGVSELVNLAGYYTMVSMTLNTFDAQVPEGKTPPFDE